MMCVFTLLASSAAAQFVDQLASTNLMQLSMSSRGEAVIETFDFSRSTALDLIPEWCKNDTQLTWKQRKERMQQHATLQWCKKEVKELREKNETVPAWMDKLVTDDENKGRMKWAVQEAKRLKAEQKEVPDWMTALVAEDNKWANRWAACKAAELRAAHEEVPQWMTENGRLGIMEYASEKAQELQEQIEELDDEKQKETALVQAQGDAEVANQRILARSKETRVRSAGQQLRILQEALAELDLVEQEFQRTGEDPHKVKHAIVKAKEASDLLNQILGRKMMSLQMQMESTA